MNIRKKWVTGNLLMKVIFCLLAGSILAFPGAALAGSVPGPMTQQDFGVGALQLAADFNSLAGRFDPPLVQVKRVLWGADGRYHVTWQNDFVEISAIELPEALPVSRVRVSSSQYPTPRNVRVGDTVEDVERAYGPPHMMRTIGDEQRLVYNREGGPNPYINSLVFFIDADGKITGIALFDATAE
ncbi:MAG TPA: hypothetical protein VN611_01615 [Patescibacteria group bacterium]|nr:hypothetical protein [Patescibacteria group bacterium]